MTWFQRFLLAGLTCGIFCTNASGERLSAQEPNSYPRDIIGFPKALVESKNFPPRNRGRKVYALIVGLGRDSDIGTGIVASGSHVEEALKAAFSDNELEIQVVGFVKGDKPAGADDSLFEKRVVEDRIAEISKKLKAKQDVLFCYVMTHGAYDRERESADKEYGHWFTTDTTEGPDVSYFRSDLMNSLLSANARLTVLLSDTCNVPNPAFKPAPHPKAVPVKDYAALRTLLLEHRGQVDISASSRGQFSFYSDVGGVFTTSFLELARSHRPETTWQEFYSVLEAATQTEFERAFPKGCPYAWDEKKREVLEVDPKDVRAQRELRPFAMRPITWVVHERLQGQP